MIDTHLHLLDRDRFTYRWTEGFPSLQGAFPMSPYQEATAGCGVTGAIFMEVDAEESAGASHAGRRVVAVEAVPGQCGPVG